LLYRPPEAFGYLPLFRKPQGFLGALLGSFLAFAGLSQLLVGAFASLRQLPIGVSPGEVESEEGDHTGKQHREGLSGRGQALDKVFPIGYRKIGRRRAQVPLQGRLKGGQSENHDEKDDERDAQPYEYVAVNLSSAGIPTLLPRLILHT
jgi:hypothetical protein